MAAFLIGATCLTGCGATAPREDLSVARGRDVVVAEGLPHPNDEHEAYQAEKRGTKPIKELHGYSFYREPLVLPADQVTSLTRILSDPATYTTFAGEKKCGGFHPDYAVEWQDGTAARFALLCFGCSEAIVGGPDGVRRYDLSPSARALLRNLLAKHRQNRPRANSLVGLQVRPGSLERPSRPRR